MPERRAALFASALPERGPVLAFDFGQRRTGVAVGELSLGIAHPVTTIDTADRTQRMEQVARLVEQWQPVLFVVGMPMRDDGAEHPMAASVRKFAGQLHGRFGLAVRYVDETLSSNAADRSLMDAGVFGARRKAALDQVAAQEILQSFFEAPHACA
jgi:putative holliday junction resolvase